MFKTNLGIQMTIKIKSAFLSILFFQIIFSITAKAQQFNNSYPCYAIATNNLETDSLFKYIPEYNTWVNVGALENVNIKAMAINPFDAVIYATSGPLFGTIDTVNLVFNGFGLIGPAYKGDYGPVLIENIVGLAYDITSNRLFGINRITTQIGNGRPDSPDILLELDCHTGKVVKNAFEDSNGNPSDYATLEEVNDGTQQDFIFDAKDLAFDPFTGELIVAQDQDSPTYLTLVDKLTGEIIFVLIEVTASDVSGLTFTETGDLIGTTLFNPAYGSTGKLIEIAYFDGYTRNLGYIDNSFNNYDFHCLDCFVRKPGCYDTLYLNNESYLQKKYNVASYAEVEVLVDIDTLKINATDEIFMNNNFEVPKTSNFSAKIDSSICR